MKRGAGAEAGEVDTDAQVEAERVQEAERGARAAEEAAAAREQLVEVQREVAEVTAAHADAGAKRAAAEKTRGESVKKRARLELDVKELEERRVGNAQTQVGHPRRLLIWQRAETGVPPWGLVNWQCTDSVGLSSKSPKRATHRLRWATLKDS